MGLQYRKNEKPESMVTAPPPVAVREYITDMLAELCQLAKESHQEDLHVLLKLTRQAALNSIVD